MNNKSEVSRYTAVSICLSAAFAFSVTNASHFASGDGGLYMFNNKLAPFLYSWAENLGTGSPFVFHGAHILLLLFRRLFSDDIILYQYVFYSLLFMGIFIGFYLMLQNLGKLLVKERWAIADWQIILVSLIYIVNPINITYRLSVTNTNTYDFFLFPVMLGALVHLLSTGVRTVNVISVSLMLSLFAFSLLNVPGVIGCALFFFVVSIAVSLARRQKIEYRKLMFLVTTLILLNAYWLTDVYLVRTSRLALATSAANVVGNITSLASLIKYANLLLFYPSEHWGMLDLAGGYFREPAVALIWWSFVIINYMLFLGSGLNWAKAVILVVFIVFLDLCNPGGLFAFFVKREASVIPELGMFRTAYDKFNYFTMISFCMMVTINLLTYEKYRRYFVALSSVAIVTCSVALLDRDLYKLSINNAVSTHSHFELPDYYQDEAIWRELRSIDPNGRVLIVPVYSFDRVYTSWGYIGLDPYLEYLQGNFLGSLARYNEVANSLILELSNRETGQVKHGLDLLGINYVIIRPDYVSIPGDMFNDFGLSPRRQVDFIKTSAYFEKYKEIGPFEVYKVRRNERRFIVNGNAIYFKKINPTKYKVYLKNVDRKQKMVFLSSYNASWKLYISNNPSYSWCESAERAENVTACRGEERFFEGEELKYLYERPIFEHSHMIHGNGMNEWTIDPDYLNQVYPKEFYKENGDGSVDIELVMYFKPQSFFYLGIVISVLTLFFCLGYVGYFWMYKRCSRHYFCKMSDGNNH